MSSIITDAYQRSFQALSANEKYVVPTPFTALFLQQRPQIDMGSDQVTIETYKGNRKIAPLVSRRSSGSELENTPIRPGSVGTNDYLYSLIAQEMQLPSTVLNQRMPGEPLYMPASSTDEIKMARRRFWVNKLALDANRRILQRVELLAIQSFLTGEMDIGDTYQSSTKLVFPRSSTLKNRTVSVSWATAATAVPWTDYGNAMKEIKAKAQIAGSGLWWSALPSTAMNNLKSVYQSQRNQESGVIIYNDFSFNPDNAVPSELAFLVRNGMEYGGWIRSDYGNSKVHLFSFPESYDSNANDSTETNTDYLATANTVSLNFYDPMFFKAYYGPGKKDPPQAAFYTSNFPAMSAPSVNPSALTIGNAGIPANTFILNLYPLGKNEGMGGCVEHAPIFANVYPDVVATIATTTEG